VQAAKDNGGHDNVSVILVKVNAPFDAQSGGVRARMRAFFARLFGAS